HFHFISSHVRLGNLSVHNYMVTTTITNITFLGTSIMFPATNPDLLFILPLRYIFLCITCTSLIFPTCFVHDINSPEKNAPTVHKPKNSDPTLNHVHTKVYIFQNYDNCAVTQ
ncbi:hypothetical protein ACJX0J_039809, partial [Zea mays]